MTYLNISGYKFQTLSYLPSLQLALTNQCQFLGLKGTILLATEGINCFVAGSEKNVRQFIHFLNYTTPILDVWFKESFSDYQPFRRMLVKRKDQIIPMNNTSIAPEIKTSQRISPEELHTWYEKEKDFIILDTRNDYEVKIGTFENAHNMNLKHFRHFEDNLSTLPEDWKEKPMVTFCTGGIRCEKAAPLMEAHGFKNVFQLDGGIINYFEKIGAAHYNGECFVFDRRVAIDPNLNETHTAECFNCRSVLTIDEQKDERYIPGNCCPECYSL